MDLVLENWTLLLIWLGDLSLIVYIWISYRKDSPERRRKTRLSRIMRARKLKKWQASVSNAWLTLRTSTHARYKGMMARKDSIFSREGKAWGSIVTMVQMSLYLIVIAGTYRLTEFAFRLIEYGIAEITNTIDMPVYVADYSWVFSVAFSLYVFLRFVAESYKWFTLYVPQYMAAILVNQITGERKKFQAGSYRKMPWEAAMPHMYFLLEVISIDIDCSFNTKNGGVAKNTISVRYKPNFKLLDKYAQVDEVTIATGMADAAKTVATQIIGKTKTRGVMSKLGQIKAEIDKDYLNKQDKIEKDFGIEFVGVSFGDVEFAPKTQETLDTIFSTESLLNDHKDNPAMRDDILVLQTKGKVNKDIKDIRFDVGEKLGPELVQSVKFIAGLFGKKSEGGTT